MSLLMPLMALYLPPPPLLKLTMHLSEVINDARSRRSSGRRKNSKPNKLVGHTICSVGKCSLPKVKILQGVWIDPICPNLPIKLKISVNKKELIYTSFEREFNTDHILLKNLGGLDSTSAVMCRRSYGWRHGKNIYFQSNFKNFWLDCSCQFNLI